MGFNQLRDNSAADDHSISSMNVTPVSEEMEAVIKNTYTIRLEYGD